MNWVYKNTILFEVLGCFFPHDLIGTDCPEKISGISFSSILKAKNYLLPVQPFTLKGH